MGRYLTKTIVVLITILVPLKFIQAEPLAEKDKLVMELFEIMGVKHSLVVLTKDLVQLEFQKRLNSNPNVSKEAMAKAMKIVTDTFEESVDEILVPMRKLYTNEFTDAELKELIKFQSSPTGQKAAKLMPKLTQQGMVLGQRWGQNVGIRAFQRIQRELKKDGIDI